MLEIKGKVSTAICYAKVIETEALGQIRRMCDAEFSNPYYARRTCGKRLHDRNNNDNR